jgi:hypothetical protein
MEDFFQKLKTVEISKMAIRFCPFYFIIRNVMADLFTVQFFSSQIRVIFTGHSKKKKKNLNKPTE